MATQGTESSKLVVVDGLRGLAVLLVISFHHRLESEGFRRTAVFRMLAPTRYGWIGVHLFLVLSGFCLAYSFLRRAESGRDSTLASYLGGRVRRIVPAYYAAIALYLVLGWFLRVLGRPAYRTDVVDARQILTHLTFVHGLWSDTIEAFNSPFWSLSLEFQFYLILPLIFVACSKIGARSTIALLAVASLIWRVVVVWQWPEGLHLLNGFFLGRVTEFGFGVLAAFWFLDRTRDELWMPRNDGGLVAVGLVLVGLGLVIPGWFNLVVADHVIGLGWTCLLIAALRSTRRVGWLARVLSGRWIVCVGSVSYSLYLTHSLALAVVDRNYVRVVGEISWVTDLGLVAAVGLAIAAVGTLFYLGIERRFLRSVDRKERPLGDAGSPGPMLKRERPREQVGRAHLANR